MKKQKLPLSLGLVLMLSSSLVVTPNRANAGQVQIQGTTQESSGFSGGSFVPSNPVSLPPQVVPGTNAGITNGLIFAPPAVQNNVNNTAGNIVNSSTNTLTGRTSIVLIIILRGPGAPGAANQLESIWSGFGVSSGRVQALITALSKLFGTRIGATQGFPVGQLTTGQLVASTKVFAASSVIAQNDPTPNVDINQLNDAINAYNNIVQESSPETLKELSKDPNFLEVGKVLRELRTSLKK